MTRAPGRWINAAFSFTALTALCLFSGVTGYNPSRHFSFIHWGNVSTEWALTAGTVCGVIAAVSWRQAIREKLNEDATGRTS